MSAVCSIMGHGTHFILFVRNHRVLCFANFCSQDITSEASATNSLTINADKEKVAQNFRWN
jgi:hypothetical protein